MKRSVIFIVFTLSFSYFFNMFRLPSKVMTRYLGVFEYKIAHNYGNLLVYLLIGEVYIP